MSFKRDGDDPAQLGVLQKRRVADLLANYIPEDEALLLRSGRYACTVCAHRPVFDTLDMLTVHRAGRRHTGGEWGLLGAGLQLPGPQPLSPVLCLQLCSAGSAGGARCGTRRRGSRRQRRGQRPHRAPQPLSWPGPGASPAAPCSRRLRTAAAAAGRARREAAPGLTAAPAEPAPPRRAAPRPSCPGTAARRRTPRRRLQRGHSRAARERAGPRRRGSHRGSAPSGAGSCSATCSCGAPAGSRTPPASG
ncbi:sodium channel modifier 1 isoform X1 [Colius striatus]|uniref:sodium channel modifier 1 isoform X1 n=1 Tax=Colius striatus TaxID=57412 RepID=UPI002B1DB13B|nr:sodium channel modifier 1 isoform X1 [Colius striatus]